MIPKNWLAKWFGRRRTTPQARPRAALYLEQLETRLTPAVGFGKTSLTGTALTNAAAMQADVDNDGLPDPIDPFAIDAANGKTTPLPVNYSWVNGAPSPGGLLNLGFTGLMTNSVTDYLQQYDPTKLTVNATTGVFTINAVDAGTAKGAANNQDNGFQFGVNARLTTPPFVVHTIVKGPFAGITHQAGQQIGIQFGTGDQDNYVELAIDGGGSVQLMKEIGGAWSTVATTSLTLGGQMDVDLYLTVNPAAGTASGGFTTTVNGATSAETTVGSATSIPTSWFSAATAPAVGIMTTTGGGPSFAASYKSMQVQYTWTAGANLPVSFGEVAGGIINGKLYLVSEGTSLMMAYDVNTNNWTSSGLAVRPFVGDHQAAEVLNGQLYLFGGLDGNSAGKVESYNPVTNTWSQWANMPWAGGSISTSVIGGLVYAAGGIISGTSTTVSQAAVYNPATNTWSAIASMPMGLNHSAAATDGSKFYIFGGRTGGNVVANGFNTVEIYNPTTNTWVSSTDPGSTIAPLPQARGGMGKGVYYNGEFYVLGGETTNGAGATSNHVYDRVDIYNPTTNTWRLGIPMIAAEHGIFPLLGTTAQGATSLYVAGGGTHSASSTSTNLQILLLSAGNVQNQPPVVSAGSNQTITLPAAAALNGTANDSTLPNGPLVTTWSNVSGPGTVTFGNASALATTASFSTSGTYVLRLTASDGQFAPTSDVTITVNPAGTNQPPQVSAGNNQTITLPVKQVNLTGAASDDGLPAGSTLVTAWSTVSGPDTVTFANANALATTASFSTSGTYVLRLTASDGQFAPTSDVTITVNPLAAGPTVTGLTLINAATNQPVPGVTLVLGATNNLNLATLPAGLSIRADVGTGVGSVVFGYDTNNNIRTESVAPYSFNGDNNGVYNPFTFTVGTHTVAAQAFSGSGGAGTAGTPVALTLNVTNAAQNQPPVVSAGSNQTITLPASAMLNGTATDSTLPNGPLVTTWSTVSGPGTVTFGNANALTTTASFSTSGTYVLRLTASDGQFAPTSDVTITVNPLAAGPTVTGFTLIDTATNQPVPGVTLVLGATNTLSLAALPPGLSIRADVGTGAGSVVFGYDTNNNIRTESVAPYAFNGDNNGVYNPFTFTVGTHTVSAEAFSGSGATGTAGTLVTLPIVFTY